MSPCLYTQRATRPLPIAIAIFVVSVAVAHLLPFELSHAQTADGADFDYMTSGVGSDEIERLRAREREFNLKLVFTLAEGNYISDVAVVVKNREGNPVLVVHAPGPLVLARLPSGAYVVEATYEGKAQARKIDLRDRLHTEYLRWPSDPQTDFPGPKATERE